MTSPRKIALLGSLYLSQGLPFGFFTQALPVLMRQRGMSLPAIGLAHLLALPWALKFIWAPLVDRYPGGRLGRRRGYILPLQLLAAATMLGLAFVPQGDGSLAPLLTAVLVTNLLAATQDIATDALAVDLLDEKERGLGNGVQVAGYRVGMILGGGVILTVFDRLGWALSFAAMSVTLVAATVPIALHHETPIRRRDTGDNSNDGNAAKSSAFTDWFTRPGGARWLGVLLAFKTGEALGSGMLRTFLVDRHLDLADIGWMLGTVGFTAGLTGALLGGALVNQLGRRGAMIAFGVLQSMAVASYAAAAVIPQLSMLWLYVIVGFEHLASGMATAALFTAIMDACRPERAAGDYTLQASVVVIATGGAAAVSGFSAARLGYAGHFALAAAVSLAAALWVALHRGPLIPRATQEVGEYHG